MTDFAYKSDAEAVHYEFRARQLVPRLQILRDCILSMKEEAMDVVAQQWARSKRAKTLADFALTDDSIRKVEDELAHLLFLIRELKTAGHRNQDIGVSEMDT